VAIPRHGGFDPNFLRKFLNAPKKGNQNPLGLPMPPQGTYDPSLDYNSQASALGLQQAQDDAATAYAQGKEDYGVNAGNLLTQHNNNLADIGRNFTILGHQQADHAAQQGITSPGLLGLSAQKRTANQGLETGREDQAYGAQKQALDLGYARQFGGYGGNAVNDPLSGQPVFGLLATQLARAGQGNTLYQQGLNNQKIFDAQQSGYTYTPPRPTRKQATKVGAYIGSH
jgi:hypothetical protein